MKLLFPIALILLMTSCAGNQEENRQDESQLLFQNSVDLISKFSENIKMAGDSLLVDSLKTEFDKQLADLNFNFPPNTDLKLTEQDNDSIYTLINNFRNESEKRLVELHEEYLLKHYDEFDQEKK